MSNRIVMKRCKQLFLPVLAVVFLSSCVSVRVVADYDREADFNSYKTFAFYKTGIDKAEISDLDKKRILKAIDAEMASIGFQKSNTPDLLVSIFTKEKERVDVFNQGFGPGWGWGWGWGWGGYWSPWWGPGWGGYWGPAVSTRTEGVLFIDLIDAKSNELVWQGQGRGSLNTSGNIEKKEARIKEFVSEILSKYPPNAIASN